MIVSFAEHLEVDHGEWSSYWERFQSAHTLSELVWHGLQIGLLFARIVVESEIHARANQPTEWPNCGECGRRCRSKGQVSRQMKTLIGEIQWTRRVGRCPGHCKMSQCCPSDIALGVRPHQRVGDGLQRLGCLLCIMLPYNMAAWLLGQWSGLSVSQSSLFHWVQEMGASAMEQLEQQVRSYIKQGELAPESLGESLAQLSLAISADGVMVPFRPMPHSPKGKTQWREVKVGLFTRLGHRVTRTGKQLSQLLHRRVVAHLGPIDAFGEKMRWQAARQSIQSAPECIWLSDGGKGFWGLFHRWFEPLNVIGILDFYHAAGHLWKAASTLFDGRTTEAKAWFQRWRHLLRHGGHQRVLSQLTHLINTDHLCSASELEALIQVQTYLQTHHEHIRYARFDQQGHPLGSGMIESTCKWLIQQRFKGVGMRWSEEGFNHLLHLRVFWVNQRFDALFPTVTWTEQLPSPKL